jgi:hypothetical protein
MRLYLLDLFLQSIKVSIYYESIMNLFLIYLVQTFARVFINGVDAKIYEEAFKALFKLISNQLNKDIHWKYLHGDGITVVVTDMDMAQLKGNLFIIHFEYITNKFQDLDYIFNLAIQNLGHGIGILSILICSVLFTSTAQLVEQLDQLAIHQYQFIHV